MSRAIKQRLQVHQDWIGDIPLKNLWGVSIEARGGSNMAAIGSNIQSVVDDYQPGSYVVETDLIDKFTSSDVGFLLAQNIAMPREEVSISNTSIGSVGGFIGGFIGGNRVEYGGGNIIDITFLETNTDIFDFFIKPWIVATSFKGLIEDDLDIKCNLTVTQYTRTDQFYTNKSSSSQELRNGLSRTRRSGTNSAHSPYSFVTSDDTLTYKPRKITTLFNCAPIRLQADQMSYGQLAENDITKPVGWTFEYYKISNPNKG